jgi:hypothetical protein
MRKNHLLSLFVWVLAVATDNVGGDGRYFFKKNFKRFAY